MEIKHGLNTYVSKPSSGDGSNKIIFLPDIFGIYPNAKLLADEWAGQGYEVYLPDLFDGSPIDHELLNVGDGGWTLLITLRRPLSPTSGSRSPPRPSPKPPTLSRWAPPWAHGSSPTERPVRPLSTGRTMADSCCSPEAQDRSLCQGRQGGPNDVSTERVGYCRIAEFGLAKKSASSDSAGEVDT